MYYKAGMFIYALAFLLGVVFVQQLTVLPVLSSFVALFASLLLLYLVLYNCKWFTVYRPQITLVCLIISLILFGMLYSSFYAKQQMAYRLDDSLIGENLLINGFVSSIPATNEKAQRFEFVITKSGVLTTDGILIALLPTAKKVPEKIRISWYSSEPVHAGEKWQLEVRLKPPRGFMNPGGFDYEAWLFQNGIDATGYVRKSALNQRQPDRVQAASIAAFMMPVNTIRQSLSKKIDAISSKTVANNQFDTGQTDSLALIKALAIGDKSSIANHQWQVLRNTGTSHLMAISGLHIGLAAFFAYALIRWLVPVFVMKRMPAQHIALSGGLIIAVLYAMVAGLSIPTQRAIIMLFILSLMMLLRRNHRPFDALGFALLLVLLFDPLAVLSIGFWFSFSAVAVIFIALTASNGSNQTLKEKQKTWFHSVYFTVSSVLKQWVRLQLYITLFLLPLSLFMFQQASLVSPIANLLLIPYVSFLVVPLVLMAIIFSFLMPAVADFLFSLAAVLLDFIWPLLSWLAMQPYALWVRGDIDIIKLLSLTMAMLLLYFSVNLSRFIFLCGQKCNQQQFVWTLRFIAALLFSPLFITTKQALKTGEYKLTVLDVGQGSAAVLQTKKHVMVFDAGAKFSDKFDIGSSVVIPYLRSQGIQLLDYLIISHADNDHIGGAQAILDMLPETAVIGQGIENLASSNKQYCVEGKNWQWDGVYFSFISPMINNMAQGDALAKRGLRNNRSCVLQVSSAVGSLLFAGDIEKVGEQRLVAHYGKQLDSEILIVPHHGSKTSSTTAFINAVDPEVSIFSVGYKNRYKHPNKDVLQRYQEHGGSLLQTDKSGALTISLTHKTGRTIEKYRQTARRYWHHAGD